MPWLATPEVRLHYELHGAGPPVTVVAHGLAGTIGEARAAVGRVAGTRVFLDFRGHGRSDRVEPGAAWDYAGLARDLRSVADEVGATRAFGMSMGASALLALLGETPDRFERCVFYLPAALDVPRTGAAIARYAAAADLVERGDTAGLAAALGEDLPPELRHVPAVAAYLRARAVALAGQPAANLLRELPRHRPVADRVRLAAVTADCLVVAQEGDDVHPAGLARQLAAALPRARLHVFPEPGGLWTHRTGLHRLVAGFLDGP